MSPSSTTQELLEEVDALREQLLDVGDDATDLAGHVKKLRQAFQVLFERVGQPVPDFLQDNPPPGCTSSAATVRR